MSKCFKLKRHHFWWQIVLLFFILRPVLFSRNVIFWSFSSQFLLFWWKHAQNWSLIWMFYKHCSFGAFHLIIMSTDYYSFSYYHWQKLTHCLCEGKEIIIFEVNKHIWITFFQTHQIFKVFALGSAWEELLMQKHWIVNLSAMFSMRFISIWANFVRFAYMHYRFDDKLQGTDTKFVIFYWHQARLLRQDWSK